MSWLSQALHGDTTSIAQIGGIVAAPFTAGASLSVTAAATAAKNAQEQQKAAEDKAAKDRAAAVAIANAQAKAGQRNVSDLAQFSRVPGEIASSITSSPTSLLLLGVAAILVFVLFLKR